MPNSVRQNYPLHLMWAGQQGSKTNTNSCPKFRLTTITFQKNSKINAPNCPTKSGQTSKTDRSSISRRRQTIPWCAVQQRRHHMSHRYLRYYRGIRGNGFRVDGIPAVVGTTSTGVPWEWELPLPERYIIFGATVVLWSIMHFCVGF